MVREEEMDQIMQEYAALLRARQALDIDVPPDAPAADEHALDDNFMGYNLASDSGVTRWATKTLEEIYDLVGVENGHIIGRPELFEKAAMWHQWVAVIEMVKRTFTNELGKKGTPTLLADQVGLGKTITTILYLQVIWHLQVLQTTNPNWPEVGDDPGHKFWPALLGK